MSFRERGRERWGGERKSSHQSFIKCKGSTAYNHAVHLDTYKSRA